MMSVDEALARLRDSGRTLVDVETAPLRASRGRVLGGDVVSAINVPPAENSAMDGYALRRADWPGPGRPMPVSQRVVAGSRPQPLQPGTAARIFTGAGIPPGADLVVIQENCQAGDGTVLIPAVGGPGANIRPKGQDIAAGATVLRAGHRLRPQDIGLVASLGIERVDVMRRLKVAVISTGAELVEPGEVAGPGKIYNSNRYLLEALFETWGFGVVDFGITTDDPRAIAGVMTEASRAADVIVTSGGVSVGEEDHVKAVVGSLGHIDLWRVAIKPGKPFAFGEVHGKPFIGLPGNPVSVFVTALVIARPFLFACQGATQTDVVPFRQTALFDKTASSRHEYLRARSGPEGVVMFAEQSSGVLFSTSWSDGLVVQKPGEDIVRGSAVDVIPYALFG